MCDSYLKFDDELFDEVLQPLDVRLPKAMAFLRRVGCVGLKVDSVGTSIITLVPLLSLGEGYEVLTRGKAKALGMTSEEEQQFVRRPDEPEKLFFCEPWQWRAPRLSRQKGAEPALA